MSHISLSCHVFFGIFGESNGKGQARAVCLPTPGDDLQMRPSPSRGLSGASSIFVDAGQSRPDGSILDAEGGLWNAEFGAGSAWSYPRENVAWMTKFLLHIGMDDGWLHTNYILKESRHIICICKYDYAHACNIFVGPAQTDRETVHSEALKMSLTLFVCIYMNIYRVRVMIFCNGYRCCHDMSVYMHCIYVKMYDFQLGILLWTAWLSICMTLSMLQAMARDFICSLLWAAFCIMSGILGVVRYLPDGSVSMVVKVPVRYTTCAAFGGEDIWPQLARAGFRLWRGTRHVYIRVEIVCCGDWRTHRQDMQTLYITDATAGDPAMKMVWEWGGQSNMSNIPPFFTWENSFALQYSRWIFFESTVRQKNGLATGITRLVWGVRKLCECIETTVYTSIYYTPMAGQCFWEMITRKEPNRLTLWFACHHGFWCCPTCMN